MGNERTVDVSGRQPALQNRKRVIGVSMLASNAEIIAVDPKRDAADDTIVGRVRRPWLSA
jgi:hypothetical protein